MGRQFKSMVCEITWITCINKEATTTFRASGIMLKDRFDLFNQLNQDNQDNQDNI